MCYFSWKRKDNSESETKSPGSGAESWEDYFQALKLNELPIFSQLDFRIDLDSFYFPSSHPYPLHWNVHNYYPFSAHYCMLGVESDNLSLGMEQLDV